MLEFARMYVCSSYAFISKYTRGQAITFGASGTHWAGITALFLFISHFHFMYVHRGRQSSLVALTLDIEFYICWRYIPLLVRVSIRIIPMLKLVPFTSKPPIHIVHIYLQDLLGLCSTFLQMSVLRIHSVDGLPFFVWNTFTLTSLLASWKTQDNQVSLSKIEMYILNRHITLRQPWMSLNICKEGCCYRQCMGTYSAMKDAGSFLRYKCEMQWNVHYCCTGTELLIHFELEFERAVVSHFTVPPQYPQRH